jgi:hypothetical protein
MTGSRRFYSAVALTTCATLMMQVVQTRILSVVTWYYLAFMVVGLAMFGLSAGSVWVYLKGDRIGPDASPCLLSRISAACALVTAACLLLEILLSPLESGTGPYGMPLLIPLVGAPFLLSGIVVSLVLTRSRFHVGRVYAADMAGAAFGCLAALWLLDHVSGPAAMLWIACLFAVAALLFAQGRSATLVALAGALALLATAGSMPGTPIRLLAAKGHVEGEHGVQLLERWNSISRVAVYDEGSGPPRLWGPALDAPLAPAIAQRRTQIDGLASTFSYRWPGDLRDLGFLRFDVTSLAYNLPGLASALVIGVGGGRDLLAAKLLGVGEVTAVDLNGILVDDLLTESDMARFVGLRGLPGVTVLNAEARSWLSRSPARFDVIQMSLIDTWAATGAGAYALSENRLYTLEAWGLMMDHLTPSGVVSVSRWYSPVGVSDTTRLVALATALLLDRGVRVPRGQLFLVASTRPDSPVAIDPIRVATLILSAAPFTPAAIAAIESEAARRGYEILVGPRTEPSDPTLRAIVDAGSRSALDRVVGDYPFDISPPADARPFFFNMLRFGDAVRIMTRPIGGPGVQIYGNLVSTLTLVTMFAVSLLLVVATILAPLAGSARTVARPLMLGGTLYFALIGLGFMLTEVALLQRLSVFLGHPVYSLSIVLFALILATAAGSLLSGRLAAPRAGSAAAGAAATGLYIMALTWWVPPLIGSAEFLPLVGRAAICVAIVGPAGLLMGFALPLGMGLMPAGTTGAWFWGVNGAASVLATSLSVAISLSFGIDATLLAGGACYLALALPVLLLRRHPAGRLAPA